VAAESGLGGEVRCFARDMALGTFLGDLGYWKMKTSSTL
jgi:hypothetical protein